MGEEKTKLLLPTGYGYKYRASDRWFLNYMIHDLVDRPFDVRITYDITFIPAKNTKPLTSVIPIWMDVQNGSVYPVFDVHRGSGTNGQFTYPDPANNPYPGRRKNTYKMPTAGTFVAAGGHLHPGGLWDDLYVDRGKKSAHVFRSNAKYFEPAGPVSWDVTLGIARAELSIAREGRRHVAPDDDVRLDALLVRSHGHPGRLVRAQIDEGNRSVRDQTGQHAGEVHARPPQGEQQSRWSARSLARRPVDVAERPDHEQHRRSTTTNTQLGDLASATSIPTVHQGQSIRFRNTDAPGSGYGTWHTITDCALPCNRSTGIAYPTRRRARSSSIRDNSATTVRQPRAALTWDTPTDLPPGTYAYWCRVHPFMRGAFRVVP